MCGYTCIRYLVFGFNFIFFISGGAILGTGIYLRVEKSEDYLELCDKYSWVTGANILIAAGAVIFVIAFCGCYGAYKQSSCLLGIFFVLLLVIFVCELAAGIYAATNRGKVEDKLTECLNSTFDNYNSDEGIRKAWENVQKKFHCCGANGRKDYEEHDIQVPGICNTYPEGCKKKIENDIKDNLVIVIGVGIGFAVIEILGMVMSMWLICQIKGRGEFA